MMRLHEVEQQLKAASLQAQPAPAVAAEEPPAAAAATNGAPVAAPPPPSPHDLIASHLYHMGFAQGLHSDLRLRVQVTGDAARAGSDAARLDGAAFKLHRLLAVRSPLLASLVRDLELRPDAFGASEVTLVVTDPNVTPDGLSIALGHLYASYTQSILAAAPAEGPDGGEAEEQRQARARLLRGVLAASVLLRMPDLASLAASMARASVGRETCGLWASLDPRGLYGGWSGEVRDAVFAYLSRGAVRELVSTRGPVWGNRGSAQYGDLVRLFAGLPFEWVKRVIESREGLEVSSDMERFQFAKDVIALRAKQRGQAGGVVAGGEENVLMQFGTGRPGLSAVTVVRKAVKGAEAVAAAGRPASPRGDGGAVGGLLGGYGGQGASSAPAPERRVWKAGV